eukprot:jgi/Tetstr1/424462/TSEL_014991.t1
MNRPHITLSVKRRTYETDEPEAVAQWVASFRSRLHDAFGSDKLAGQRAFDLLSCSLNDQTLKSYAGKPSQLAEFCHDSKNISPLEATTAMSSGCITMQVVYREKRRAGRHGPNDLRVLLLHVSEHPRVARLMHHFIDNTDEVKMGKKMGMSKKAKAAANKAKRDQKKNYGRLAGAKVRSTVHGKARLPFTASQCIKGGVRKNGKKGGKK